MSKDKPSENNEETLGRRELLKLGGIGLGTGLMGNAFGQQGHRATAQQQVSQWPSAFDPLETHPPYPPRDRPKPGEKIHVHDIEVTIEVHEIVPGVQTHMFMFNKSYPGPEIRVKEGDWVQINLKNSSPEFHTIHWHGIMVPMEMDGVPLGTQWPVGPNQEFRYLWKAQPTGTHFYHCHVMTTLHQQAGLVGSLIVEPKEPDIVQKTFPYKREYTMILSELDTNFVRNMMSEMVEMGVQMERMNHSAKMMREMNGKMMGWFKSKEEFVKAVKNGYIPPYLAARTGTAMPITPNYFMINGKSYPMTDPLMIRRDENIRVRLIAGGFMPHFIHLHGHDFWHVCQDGSPLAAPVRMNTIPIYPGTTSDIVIQGTNPGFWHFHDHSDLCTTNNGQHPGGMMTMLMYEDAREAGIKWEEVIAISS
ncbi:MAG: multicopper oxidase domain-containing protein [Armatimonadetes bacterium]|nr:multicopper oxidase domain-containing protein [Armatimonadota bacterium]